MKKLLTILIGCSVALTVSVIAQQEEASQPPKAEHKAKGAKPAGDMKPVKEVKPSSEAKPAGEMKPAHDVKPAHEVKPPADAKPTHERKAIPESAIKEQPEIKAPPAETKGTLKHSSAPESSAEIAHKQQAEQLKKEQDAARDVATTRKPANPNPASVTAPSPASINANAAPAAAINPANAANPQANKMNPHGKKPDPQVVQKVKTEHASFKAQPKPDKVPTVTFNQSYRIEGSDRWEGQRYERFRSYHPEMHDHGWYHSHYTRVEVIGGGAYYWNEGYWYPAWGYNTSAQYYPYDGPIYVGSRAEPPDRIIAEVQGILQAEGYYQGEVDGLLGPLTRQALTAYQADNGLYTTAAIDEPTLASLDLG